MSNTEEENQFLSLNMDDDNNMKSGGLDFLPSNYDYDTDKSQKDDSQNNPTDSILNFGNYDQPTQVRHRGNVGNYLDKYGVGWLLDQNNLEIETEDSLPLLEELDIDLSGIKYKIKCVIMPLADQTSINRAVLKDDPDFWGPLFIVLLFSIFSVYGQFRVISWIITIWIFGSFLVFVIARVLGGEVTYSQSVGIIGYSLLPLLFIAFLNPIVKNLSYLNFLLRMICVAWSTYSAATLLCTQELQHKKPLLLYPIFLLYIYFLSLYSGA